jgi:ABC-type dipeptide/oligopeptide/nickel transport system permease subunit
LVAGYRAGPFDAPMMRLWDMLLAFPAIATPECRSSRASCGRARTARRGTPCSLAITTVVVGMNFVADGPRDAPDPSRVSRRVPRV